MEVEIGGTDREGWKVAGKYVVVSGSFLLPRQL